MRVCLPIVLVVACSARAEPKEVLVGGPCENCEAAFQGRPPTLTWSTRIAPPGEPGEPLTIEGTVRDAGGTPAAGVIVLAYHTNAKGLYPSPRPPTNHRERQGTLRAFVQTGADGRYRFETIRPASYPNSTAPQHVHMQIVEPNRCYYWIDDVMFTDDPNLAGQKPTPGRMPRGGNGVVTPTRTNTGWLARRDITLGAGIADYARCR